MHIGKTITKTNAPAKPNIPVGTVGYLAVFLWSLIMVLVSPSERLPLAAGLSFLVAGVLYREAFRRLLHLRWLILLGILVAINTFWLGEADRQLWRIPFSSEGLIVGLQMALRALVILLAVDGFSSKADITEIAGLLERAGLRGLGFSLGVAFNLLPGLRQSGRNAWNSLRMRGGLRKKRWKGLQYLIVTVISNALRRAEDIALAAEARAFEPECARRIPIQHGKWDLAIGFLCVGVLMVIIFLR
jgi:energy-coupling factor transporter transmembrane protein EcfT